MVTEKLNLYVDSKTFYQIVDGTTNELYFPQNRTWKGKFLENPHDAEGQPVFKRYCSIIIHCVELKVHRIDEREVKDIRNMNLKTKRLLGLVKSVIPYYVLYIGERVPLEKSINPHLDFGKHNTEQWLSSEHRG